MNSSDLRGQTIRLAKAKPNVKRRIINTMTYQDMLDADAEFERWVHEGQVEPTGAAGRGCGSRSSERRSMRPGG